MGNYRENFVHLMFLFSCSHCSPFATECKKTIELSIIFRRQQLKFVLYASVVKLWKLTFKCVRDKVYDSRISAKIHTVTYHSVLGR